MPSQQSQSTKANTSISASGATTAVSSHSRLAPETSSRSSRSSSHNKGADRYATDHPPAATKSGSKRTSSTSHLQVPVSALSAQSSHSTRRDNSSRRDSAVSGRTSGRHGSSKRSERDTPQDSSRDAGPYEQGHSYHYENGHSSYREYDSRDDDYSGNSAYRGQSSRYSPSDYEHSKPSASHNYEHSEVSTYRNAYNSNPGRYMPRDDDDEPRRRPEPVSTALARRSSRQKDGTTLAPHASTKLSAIPEDHTVKSVVKGDGLKKSLGVKVPKGANVVINIYNGPVVNQIKDESDSKRK